MATMKFVYFDIRARGETSRLVLAASGKKWEDTRVPFDKWPAEKPNAPFGQLPYLVYDGHKYGQSNAIASFLAKEFGLYGKSNLDGLRIEEVLGLQEDHIRTMAKAKFESDEAKKAELSKKLESEDTPEFLKTMETLLKENGDKGFFVGTSVSVADLAVYNLVETIVKINADALSSCPLVQKLKSNVAAHPNIKTYLASRKDTEF